MTDLKPVVKKKFSTIAIVSFVGSLLLTTGPIFVVASKLPYFSLAGFFSLLMWFLFAAALWFKIVFLFLCVLLLALGFIALRKTISYGLRGKTLAIVGIILTTIFFIPSAFVLIWWVVVVLAA